MENVHALEWLLMLGCLVFSAFFSASETAITSLGTLKSRHIMEKNKRVVRYLQFWLTRPDRVISTILVINNIANIVVTALATDIATRMFGDQGVGIAVGVVTILVLVFGEVIPKSFAKANAETFGLVAIRVVYAMHYVFWPAVWVLSGFAQWMLKITGGQPESQPQITEEEIEFLMQMGQRAGVLEDIKKEMIDGVFDFDETKVREIMTPRTDVVAVKAKQSIKDLLQVVIESGYSRIPVYEESIDRVVGIVLAKDVIGLAVRDGQSDLAKVEVQTVMREAYFVHESKLSLEVFKELKKTKNHLAVVVDEYGGTAGLVTMENILEEIVGEIQDEFDVEEAKIIHIADRVFDVSGSVNIDEFMERFSLNEEELDVSPEGDLDTIGGWLTHLLGELPAIGQKVTLGPLTIEVIETERHRIQRVRVTQEEVKLLESADGSEQEASESLESPASPSSLDHVPRLQQDQPEQLSESEAHLASRVDSGSHVEGRQGGQVLTVLDSGSSSTQTTSNQGRKADSSRTKSEKKLPE